jgi:hypothetical protein
LGRSLFGQPHNCCVLGKHHHDRVQVAQQGPKLAQRRTASLGGSLDPRSSMRDEIDYSGAELPGWRSATSSRGRPAGLWRPSPGAAPSGCWDLLSNPGEQPVTRGPRAEPRLARMSFAEMMPVALNTCDPAYHARPTNPEPTPRVTMHTHRTPRQHAQRSFGNGHLSPQSSARHIESLNARDYALSKCPWKKSRRQEDRRSKGA